MDTQIIANPMVIGEKYQYTYLGGETLTYTVWETGIEDYGVSFGTAELFRVRYGSRIHLLSVLFDPNAKPKRKRK